MGGKFKLPVNNQLFDTSKALDLHLKDLHASKKWNPNLQRRDSHNHVGDSHPIRQRRSESSKTSSNRPKSSFFRMRRVLLKVHQRFFEMLKAEIEELEGEVKDKNGELQSLSKKTTELTEKKMSRIAIVVS